MELTRRKTIAPDEIPLFVGQFWVDTVAKRAWIAMGTNALSDWTEMSISSAIKIRNTDTNKDVAVTVEGDPGPPDSRTIVLGAET